MFLFIITIIVIAIIVILLIVFCFYIVQFLGQTTAWLGDFSMSGPLDRKRLDTRTGPGG